MLTHLIADSGATKTDWCLIKEQEDLLHFQTPGINPYLQKQENILAMLQKEISLGDGPVDIISYYGAGIANKEKQQLMGDVLKKHFGARQIDVHSDTLAAARALCGDEPGIVCILGTGSSACYYNGNIIKETRISLGYLAGDEGSGNHMGKRVLQHYAYNTFDAELRMAFEQLYGNDISAILTNLYERPYPNRYLAKFTALLIENRGHFMVENIIEDCLNDFFQQHILKFRQSWKLPISFTGSIAHGFKDVLDSICQQYELQLGEIEKSPMKGLIKYHSRLPVKD